MAVEHHLWILILPKDLPNDPAIGYPGVTQWQSRKIIIEKMESVLQLNPIQKLLYSIQVSYFLLVMDTSRWVIILFRHSNYLHLNIPSLLYFG